MIIWKLWSHCSHCKHGLHGYHGALWWIPRPFLPWDDDDDDDKSLITTPTSNDIILSMETERKGSTFYCLIWYSPFRIFTRTYCGHIYTQILAYNSIVLLEVYTIRCYMWRNTLDEEPAILITFGQNTMVFPNLGSIPDNTDIKLYYIQSTSTQLLLVLLTRIKSIKKSNKM